MVSFAFCQRAVTEAASQTTSESPLPEESDLRIELDGNPETEVQIENDCFAESDKAFVYFQKGVTVKGDILESVDKAMRELEGITGITFERKIEHDSNSKDLWGENYFESEIFSGINKDEEKVDIFIVNFEDGCIPYAEDVSFLR